MSELKRIDPKAVPGMFRKHGLRPVREQFGFINGPDYDCGCVLTALVVERHGRAKPMEIHLSEKACSLLRAMGAAIDLDRDYAAALGYGWDDRPLNIRSLTEAKVLGHRDGRAAWLACVEAKLVAESAT